MCFRCECVYCNYLQESNMARLRLPVFALILASCIPTGLHAQRAPQWKVCDSTQMRYANTIGTLISAASSDDIASIGDAGFGYTPHIVRQTTDSGATWNTLYTEAYHPGQWRSIVHPSKNNYFISGENAKYLGDDKNGNVWNIYTPFLLISRDAGSTWTKTLFDSNVKLRDIAMLSETYGAAILFHQGNIYDSLPYTLSDSVMVTDDAWKTWTTIPGPPGIRGCQQVFCFGKGIFELITYPVASIAYSYRTTDGGKNWIRGGGLPLLVQIVYVNSRVAWGVGTNWTSGANRLNGLIVKTTDGGANWITVFDAPVTNLKVGGFSSIAFSDSLHGVATGSAIFQTSDGGATWTSVDPPFQAPTNGTVTVLSVTMPKPDLAVAIFGSASIRYTGTSTLAAPKWHAHDIGPIALKPTTIAWTPIAGASSYELRVSCYPPDLGSADRLFDHPILDTIIADTSILFSSLTPSTNYVCYVRALSSSDTSDWRQTGDWFQIVSLFSTVSKPGVALPPVILAPANNAHIPSSVRVTWTPVQGATQYQVRYVQNQVGPDLSVKVSDTTVMLTGLIYNYYITVRAFVADDSTDWSNGVSVVADPSSGVAATDLIVPTLAPNPAHDEAHLAFHEGHSGTPFEIYDALGRQINIPSQPTPAGINLDVRALPTGSYIVRTADRTMRMLIER